jgi:tryptophan halogenase
MEGDQITKVLILGGGTAGWMTASYLSKALKRSVQITVIEAPSIPKIGVGEATIPNLQTAFFDFLGIDEVEWMRECNASFKLGIKFVNWRSAGESSAQPRKVALSRDYFYHIFGQLPNHDGIPLSHYWVWKKYCNSATQPFDYTCYKELPMFDLNLAPRTMDGQRVTNYAWHFDAHLVADFLRKFATEKQGVQHVQDQMEHVVLDERGFIRELKTKEGRTIQADLFVDCSGFRGLLINKALGEPFIDMSDHLLCNSAVATAVRHDDGSAGVEPFTSAIAMDAGWTWKIPMLNRFGTGYVYSSHFATQDQATAEFCRLWGLDPDQARLSHIRFRVGRNRRAWVNNCVSIGLSSCFVEPLESTGIYFIYAAIYQLVKHFPDKRFDPVLVRRFNEEIETMFDDTRDFIQAHFYFSPRTDTPFWEENKRLELGPDIQEKIAMYRAGLPVNMPLAESNAYYHNFEIEFRNFWTNSNYYCILAGLGLLPDRPAAILEHKTDALATVDTEFQAIARQQEHLRQTVPSNVAVLRQLHQA